MNKLKLGCLDAVSREVLAGVIDEQITELSAIKGIGSMEFEKLKILKVLAKDVRSAPNCPEYDSIWCVCPEMKTTEHSATSKGKEPDAGRQAPKDGLGIPIGGCVCHLHKKGGGPDDVEEIRLTKVSMHPSS